MRVERAVKSVRMRAKVHEYRAEEGAERPACARVQDPLESYHLCQDAAVMLAALSTLGSVIPTVAAEEQPPRKEALQSACRPEYTTAGVPLVVEVQLLFTTCSPLLEHTRQPLGVSGAVVRRKACDLAPCPCAYLV